MIHRSCNSSEFSEVFIIPSELMMDRFETRTIIFEADSIVKVKMGLLMGAQPQFFSLEHGPEER